MKVCHIGTLPLEQMGDITRVIIGNCEGEHVYHQVVKPQIASIKKGKLQYAEIAPIPKANIYILHCFKNQWGYFFHFKHPHDKCKIVSLIHSSFPCQPSRNSDYVVTITRAAAQHLKLTTLLESTIITGAIDLTEFLQIEPDYEFPVMGKISRLEPGKFHPQYFEVLEILAKKYAGSVRMISPERGDLIPEDVELNDGVRINNHKLKAQALRGLNIYADAHREDEQVFIETLCTSLLEAMACGIPPVILSTHQSAMVEVVGSGGLIADNIYEFYKAVEYLAGSEQARREWGMKARERAKSFNNLGVMITSYNNLFKAAMEG